MADDDVRDDIAKAWAMVTNKFGAKREMKRLVEYLHEGEVVERLTSGTYGPGTGLVVATNTRVLFVKDGFTAKVTEDFPWSKLTSAQWSSGILTGSLILFVAGNKAEITAMNKQDGKAFADHVRARIADHSAPAPVTNAAAAPTGAPTAGVGSSAAEVFAALERLGQLQAAGVLTEQEFSAKKAELLARL